MDCRASFLLAGLRFPTDAVAEAEADPRRDRPARGEIGRPIRSRRPAGRRWRRGGGPADLLPYRRPKLVVYRDAVSTGGGSASSAVGPFDCAADQNVYLELGFYDDMAQRLGAQGDFAWA